MYQPLAPGQHSPLTQRIDVRPTADLPKRLEDRHAVMHSTLQGVLSALALSVCAVACAPEPNSTSESDGESVVADDTPMKPAAGALQDPREYLRVHNLASNPDAEGWPDAIQTLARGGDAFTLEHLARVDRNGLSDTQKVLLEDAAELIGARLIESDAGFKPGLVVLYLERAAYADLMCDSLEGVLPTWAFANIEAHLEDPEVQAEVERLAGGYTPTFDLNTTFSSMGERVPKYARRVLRSAGEGVGEQQ